LLLFSLFAGSCYTCSPLQFGSVLLVYACYV
jgi:hypothetical protein